MDVISQASQHADLAHVIIKAGGWSLEALTERIALQSIHHKGIETIQPTWKTCYWY
jgi:hypothetical protein